MGEFGARRAAWRLVPLLAAFVLSGCLHPVTKPQAAAPAGAADAVDAGSAPSVASLPPVDDDPDHLMGKDAAALRAMLGAPGFLRRDNPAQLWRYAATGCMLELYLYRSGPSGAYVVRHVSARPVPADGFDVSKRTCLGELLRARQKSAQG